MCYSLFANKGVVPIFKYQSKKENRVKKCFHEAICKRKQILSKLINYLQLINKIPELEDNKIRFQQLIAKTCPFGNIFELNLLFLGH